MELKTIVYALIVFFVIVGTFFAYNYISKDPKNALFGIIDWLMGEKEFDYTQANQVARNYFNNPEDTQNDLIAKLEKCKSSETNNCGCELGLTGFSENHIIEVNKDELILFDNRIYENSESNVKLNEISFSNANCIWKNPNENEIKDFQIIFKKEEEVIVPKLFYETAWYKSNYEENLANIEMYKSNGNLCWLDASSIGFGTVTSCV
ncbi:hypothetical protein J4405_03535 [Candidatus Woesearchaeota archaeon]|nr:hypothetical protein [Candidatus Woesearchaeota archaeon]